jgi:hypothetical protein
VARAAGRARSQWFRVTSALKKGPRAAGAGRADTSQREASGHQPARGERTPAGGVRPVARAAGRARSQRFRATSADRSKSVIRGGARGASARGESQTLGGARYERPEGVRGRLNAAGRLAQKLPSPALKEAERPGSYNPGDLNTLTGGTIRNGTVQGHIAGGAAYAVPCESTRTWEDTHRGSKACSRH